MKTSISIAIVASLVLVAASAGLSSPAEDVEPYSETTLLAEILALGGASHLSPTLDALIPTPRDPSPSPAGLVRQALGLSQTYSATGSAQEVITATASMEGLPVDMIPVPGGETPADVAILTMYDLMGVTPTPAQALELTTSVSTLDSNAQTGLSILVEAINQGLILQDAGTTQAQLQAAVLLLDAADEVQGLSGATAEPSESGILPTDAGTSSTAACSSVFEDPLFFVRIGSDCDDVVNETGRVLVYDPAGNDEYRNNAGGADSTRFATSLPSWATNPADRREVPIALHVDEAGHDDYVSTRNAVQGAGQARSVGVLLDRGGDDSYTCGIQCQSYSGIGGLGVFVDEAGNDSFSAQRDAQASGSPAFLIDDAGDDSYFASLTGAQAGQTDTIVPSGLGALLLDRSGNDSYVAGARSQGAANRLVDLDGDDYYQSDGPLSQGAGFAQSHGFLVDRAGHDVYNASDKSQGSANGGGSGVLADFDGDDVYVAGDDSQASGRSTMARAVGILFDATGNDTYSAGAGSQGSASTPAGSADVTVAALIDREGDDVYTAHGRSQGSGTPHIAGLVLGVLVDGGGDDEYVAAGNASQGAAAPGSDPSESGVGILVDAGGQDSYSAAERSQGAAGAGGVGVLVDATRQGEGPKLDPDSYTAGSFSQGSGDGGVGILLDVGDREGGKKSSFVAGSNSQGSAAGAGTGILVNNDGTARDDYDAGPFSQGSSTGGLGLLVDRAGMDRYESTDPPTSQGFGNSTFLSGHPALGVLLDFDGNDFYDDFNGLQGNEMCHTKGDIGFVVDMNLGTLDLPSECVDAAVLAVTATATGLDAEIDAFINQLLADIDQAIRDAQETVNETVELVNQTVNDLANETEPEPPADPIFHDDFENGTNGWNVTGNNPLAAEWQLIDETTQPQVSPGARSGDHYWYVGLQGGVAYASNANATLTSPVIDLTTETSAEFQAWLAGSSERGFDQLTIRAYEAADPTNSQVLAVLDGGRTGVELFGVGPANPVPAYAQVNATLDAFLGTSIHLEFQFVTDSIYEDGQGWNLDDVAVV